MATPYEILQNEVPWMEEYGKDVIVVVKEKNLHGEETFDVVYTDHWDYEWRVPVVFLPEGGFKIDLRDKDCGLIDLHPAAYWAYLFVEAANVNQENRNEIYHLFMKMPGYKGM